MTRKVHCQLLGEELDALGFQPYPGELGKRIFENISQRGNSGWRHKASSIMDYGSRNTNSICFNE